MRVLLVAINFAPEKIGNAPYVTSLAKGLAAKGHDVEVVTAFPHYPEWRLPEGLRKWSDYSVADGISIRRLLHYVPKRPTFPARILSEISFGCRVVFSRLPKHDVALLVSPALLSSAIVLLRLKLSRHRAPRILWVQDVYSRGLEEIGRVPGRIVALAKSFESRVLRSCHAVVVIHERFQALLHEHFGVREEHTRVIRNWSHAAQLWPSTAPLPRRTLNWSDDEIVVLHAGNQGLKQGLEYVVEAARHADAGNLPIRFVLLGNGSDRSRLEELGQDTDSLQFIDLVDDHKLPAVLAAADILLVSEQAGVAEMALPSKLTTYLTAGKPIVAITEPRSITAEEVRRSQAGVIVPHGDPQNLVETCLGLAKSGKAKEMGQNGTKYSASHLSKEAAVTAFEDLLKEVMSTIGNQSIDDLNRYGSTA